MSDSDTQPDPPEEETAEAKVTPELMKMLGDLPEAGRDIPPLSGDALVTLQVRIRDAYSPENAVEQALWGFMWDGMGPYIYTVTDIDTGAIWAVQGGEVLTREQLDEIVLPRSDDEENPDEPPTGE